jgi:hypothetical protein
VVTSKILKADAFLTSHPLSYICNQFLDTGIFPDYLEIAVVKPLFQTGDKTSITNYRSVALLTVCVNVLGKATHCRLSQHLHANNILVTEHYGRSKGISTSDAAFILTNSVFKSANQKKHVGGIFYDLAKVFDCVNREILVAKLHVYGI